MSCVNPPCCAFVLINLLDSMLISKQNFLFLLLKFKSDFKSARKGPPNIKGVFSVNPGEVLKILVGHAGGGYGGPHGNENGGGGGTFILNQTTSTLLIVAGGGGGGPSTNYGSGCSRTASQGDGAVGPSGSTAICTACGCGTGGSGG